MERGELSKSVQYDGVTFEHLWDAKSWVQNDFNNRDMELFDVSLVVKPHMVLEYLYANLVGEDFLHRFKKLN